MSRNRFAVVLVVTLSALLLLCGTVGAQSSKVKGNITNRAGNQMTLKTSDGTNVVVVLNDSTDVQQIEGVLKARKKDMAMAALIPGLACEVQGTYNAQKQLGADWVRFTGQAMEQGQ